MLVNAGRLIGCGIGLEKACETTIVVPLTDDADARNTLRDVISACA
jgi:nitric oxide reductase NorQ protein